MCRSEYTAVSPGKHQYSRLPDPASYIRLLEVSEDSCNQENVENGTANTIKCQLTKWKAGRAPPYHAISYTWGAETLVQSITLEGEATGSMRVRKNLHDVLRQLLFFKTSQYYWVDALCIDQQALREKEYQVAMMGSIFANAQHVLVNLGDYSDDASFCMQVISEIITMGEMSGARSPNDGTIFWTMTTFMSPSEPDGLTTNDLKVTRKVDRMRYMRSLAALTQRPYFSRLWIVQELLLAQNASLCCGNFRVPLVTISKEIRTASEAASTVFEGPVSRRYWAPDLNGGLIPMKYEERALENDVAFREALMQPNQISECRFNWNCIQLLDTLKSTGKRDFESESAMRLLGGLQCHDQRDKIYGGLAFIQSSLRTPLKPDYTISIYQLAVKMLEHGLNPHLTNSLLGCLNLTAEDPELQAAISKRRQPVNDTFADAATYYRGRSNHMPKFELHGIQLSDPNATWTNGTYEMTIEVRISGHLITFGVPHFTTRSDWVLETCPGLAGYGLVLRQHGDRFVITGLARSSAFNGEPFQVTFDVEDLLVFVAVMTLPNTIDRSAMRLFREPFSSFAELKSAHGG